MVGITILKVLLVLAALQPTPKWETVTFKASPSLKYTYYPKITAKLRKPQGQGPFPAVVLIHGTRGIREHHYRWIERLSRWGYVALLVDSIGMRERYNPDFDPITIPLEGFIRDAYDAKSFLGSLPYVNPARIAVMGWEKGGWAILNEVRERLEFDCEKEPFQAAVTVSPYCSGFLDRTNSPLLVLMGEKDRWCPPGRCRIPSERKGDHEVILKVYEGAHHAFDEMGIDKRFQGHHFLYNQESAEDAIERINAFLRRYLK